MESKWIENKNEGGDKKRSRERKGVQDGKWNVDEKMYEADTSRYVTIHLSNQSVLVTVILCYVLSRVIFNQGGRNRGGATVTIPSAYQNIFDILHLTLFIAGETA